MKHRYSFAVRSYECDSNGHVNNATYLNYLELARTQFLRDIGASYRSLKELGFALMVVRICIDFKGQARMEDTLTVATRSLKKKLTGCVFEQRIYLDETLIADAQVSWVCIGANGKPVRLPPQLDIPELEP
jgi:acyl-CoA thioester hydrolase